MRGHRKVWHNLTKEGQRRIKRRGPWSCHQADVHPKPHRCHSSQKCGEELEMLRFFHCNWLHHKATLIQVSSSFLPTAVHQIPSNALSRVHSGDLSAINDLQNVPRLYTSLQAPQSPCQYSNHPKWRMTAERLASPAALFFCKPATTPPRRPAIKKRQGLEQETNIDKHSLTPCSLGPTLNTSWPENRNTEYMKSLYHSKASVIAVCWRVLDECSAYTLDVSWQSLGEPILTQDKDLHPPKRLLLRKWFDCYGRSK